MARKKARKKALPVPRTQALVPLVNSVYWGKEDKEYIGDVTVILTNLPFLCRRAGLRFKGKYPGDSDVGIDLTVSDMDAIVAAWADLRGAIYIVRRQ
jgi:hypothetical protein